MDVFQQKSISIFLGLGARIIEPLDCILTTSSGWPLSMTVVKRLLVIYYSFHLHLFLPLSSLPPLLLMIISDLWFMC